MSAATRARLVDGIARWHMRLPGAREILESAAVDLILEGDNHPAVAELASLYAEANAHYLDALLLRVVDELNMQDALSIGVAAMAAASECRQLLSGHLTGRELAGWVMRVFGHDSGSSLLDAIAVMDAQYDRADALGELERPLDLRMRALAIRIAITSLA